MYANKADEGAGTAAALAYVVAQRAALDQTPKEVTSVPRGRKRKLDDQATRKKISKQVQPQKKATIYFHGVKLAELPLPSDAKTKVKLPLTNDPVQLARYKAFAQLDIFHRVDEEADPSGAKWQSTTLTLRRKSRTAPDSAAAPVGQTIEPAGPPIVKGKTEVQSRMAHQEMKTKPESAAKRGPPRAPPVWANVRMAGCSSSAWHGLNFSLQTRQELCESLPYYRAFQSGLYMCKGSAYGYLLDGFSAPCVSVTKNSILLPI